MRKKIYLIALICFAIDVISKIIFSRFNEEIVLIPNFFSIYYIRNTGAAFSFFANKAFLLAVIGAIALIVMDKYFIKDIKGKGFIFYGVLVGGILGNLIERVLFLSVTDFLKFNILGYNFPIFNLADVFICLGAVLLIISMFGGVKNGNNS